jgi:subtilisin-like proprotein convertase family protein
MFILTVVNGQTFSGSVGNITDDGQPNDYDLIVNDVSLNTLSSTLGLKEVCLNITHTWNSDLNVFLISPSGTQVNLFSGIGGDGDNFTNTCLSQTATTSINFGNPPYTGQFKPQETIGNFNSNQNGNGVWKLRIIDTYPDADTGSVLNWSITFGEDAPTPFVFTSSNLPIIVINTNGLTIQDEPAINATMGIIYNGEGNMNMINDTPNEYNGNINIEYRGNYSQILPQRPFKIETLDASFEESDVSVFEMPEEHDWVLIASYNDKAFMRNTLAYSLFQDMGHYAARHKYCEVVINGTYQGVYIWMESIKRDNNRVDIAKLDPDENTGNDLTGGYILKNDLWSDNDSWQLNYSPIDHPELDVRLVYHYPKPEDISAQQQAYIQSFINDFETALYSPNFTSLTDGYRKYMDTNSFIDYFIINELSRNNDGFKKSSYFHKDKNSNSLLAKLKAGPVWDFDWAWKNINECGILATTDGSGWAHLINDCNPDNNSTGWFVRLLQDPAFQNELKCRWHNLRQTLLSESALNAYIDSNAAFLQQAQARQFERWGNLGINTGTPELENDPTTFEGQIVKFKNWITTRMNWLDNNLPGGFE